MMIIVLMMWVIYSDNAEISYQLLLVIHLHC